MKKIIYTSDAPEPVGPYNQAILANDTLYVSGQIPINPKSGNIDSIDIEIQTHQVFKNLLAVLNKAEMGLKNVVKCSIFLDDLSDFQKVNELYATYFTTDTPARECVEVSKLPKNARIEISCIAVK